MKLTRLQTIIAGRLTEVLEPEGNKEIFQALIEEITAEPEASCEASLAKAEIELERARETARQYEKIRNWAYLFRNNTAEFLGYVPGDTLPDWDAFEKMVHDRLAAIENDGAKAKIEHLEEQIKRTEPHVKAALAFYLAARYELGIDWESKDPTYEEVFNKALKVLRDCQQTDKTIFELRKKRDELLLQSDEVRRQVIAALHEALTKKLPNGSEELTVIDANAPLEKLARALANEIPFIRKERDDFRNDAKKYEDLLEKCLEVTGGNRYESLLEFVQNASELPLILEDRNQLLDRIKVLEKCETELLAKVKNLEEDVWNNREDSKRFQKANIELSAKVADLEKQLRAAKGLPSTPRPAPTMPHANAAKVLSESRTIPAGNTPPPKFIQPWTYDTSPEVIYEYVRLVVAGQSPAIAAQTAGVAAHERDKARVNFKTAIDGGKARTGVDREEFLAKQLKNWRERRDHAIAIAKKAGA